jgi:HD-like signal output (HDOD) protein/nitrogen-specific signal transduction histidine kinase
MQQIYLHNKSYSFEQLPSVPSLLVELIDLCHDDTGNFDRIAKTIQKDSGLTARIIQIANSALFRQWNEATDIQRMLVVLGLDNVRQIVISSAVHQFFTNFSKDFDRQVQFVWYRALVCSQLAQRLSQLTGYRKPQEAYLAGLLYQVGQLLLLLNQEQNYRPILEQYGHTTDFNKLEKDTFGIDHCELGAALVESWQLDSFIADAILFQRNPTEAFRGAPTLIKIIAVASSLSATGGDQVSPTSLERAGTLFNLTESSTLECLATATGKARQTAEEFGFGGVFSTAVNSLSTTIEPQEEKADRQLADRIKNLALASCHANPTSATEHEIAKNLRTTFTILFNLKTLFLIRPGSDNRLTVVNDSGLKRLDELNFKATDQSSILVKSFQSLTPLSSFDEAPSIIDQQLIRLLKTEGVRFFPLQHDAKGLGLIALGLSRAENLELSKKSLLLKLLLQDIGRTLLQSVEQQTEQPGISFEQLKNISHEVSNPLTIIKNYLYVLGKKIGAEHEAQEEIAFINEEIDRVGNILLRAKEVDRGIPEAGQSLDINKLLRNLDRIFSDSLYKTSDISARLRLDESIPRLSCSRDKTKQILINIIKNATEVMPDGGTIELSTRDNIYQNGVKFVEITIRDSGPGIPQHILQNLFSPVESTKEGHSGVGLSIVSNLISELSGTISCHSTLDDGTEFKIYLPRTICAEQVE